MMFEIEITTPPTGGGALRKPRCVGVMIDGQGRFHGERVHVGWTLARSLIASGRAKAAPGVAIPLTAPEALG